MHKSIKAESLLSMKANSIKIGNNVSLFVVNECVSLVSEAFAGCVESDYLQTKLFSCKKVNLFHFTTPFYGKQAGKKKTTITTPCPFRAASYVVFLLSDYIYIFFNFFLIICRTSTTKLR